jgi:HicA toxin of bacterial toxin-antitoxin,
MAALPFDITARYHFLVLSSMNRKHQKTLAALFAEPTRANITWNDVHALLIHLGAIAVTRGGSMFSFTLNKSRVVLHRPHPGDQLTKPGVRSVRDFLKDAGITP